MTVDRRNYVFTLPFFKWHTPGTWPEAPRPYWHSHKKHIPVSYRCTLANTHTKSHLLTKLGMYTWRTRPRIQNEWEENERRRMKKNGKGKRKSSWFANERSDEIGIWCRWPTMRKKLWHQNDFWRNTMIIILEESSMGRRRVGDEEDGKKLLEMKAT